MTDEARTQANRHLAIGTPLGEDKVLLLAMHGYEALGRLFEFELHLVSENEPVDPTKILGQNVSIRLEQLGDSPSRFFNGYISKIALTAVDETKEAKRLFSYRATMVPWAWFLTRSSDCRIFQAMAVPAIIQQICQERGFAQDLDASGLTGTYRVWEYCVQYRETDFNFISRLMENEGIYYYFTHANGTHTMVLCDSPGAHKPATGYTKLEFDEPDPESGHDAYIWDWQIHQEITPNQYALTEFDPLQPKNVLFKSLKVTHPGDPGFFEIFDYPGGYVTADDGKTYATTRMQEAEANYVGAHGSSSARGIFAGAIFKLEDHPVSAAEDYLITAVSYQLRSDDMAIGYRSQGELFHCEVTAMPNKYTFRSPRLTPKPFVQGPQTAIVVGKSGEEIWTDKYGRVKVQFPWDRDSKADENSSCWIRVSQNWAGKRWGIFFCPRVGQEVIVDFLEGDPDRPIITGRVYNGENTPPYDLPTAATISAIKSNSSKGGQGFNEFRFEDKKGDEQVFIHSEKNMDIRVKNDRFETIGVNGAGSRNLVVEKDKFEHVKNTRNETIDSHHIEKIGGDYNQNVAGKEAKSVAGSKSLKVAGDVIEQFQGKHSEVVASDYYLKADNIVIEGLTNVTIKVGNNYIAIEKDGIKMSCEESSATLDLAATGASTYKSQQTLDISCTSAGSFKSQSDLDFEATGGATLKSTSMMTVQSAAAMTIKGLTVAIN